MSYVNLLMTLTDSAATFSSYCPLGNTQAGDKQVSIKGFINYMRRLLEGQSVGTLQFSVGAAQATATLTSTGAATDAQAFILNGVTFTAKNSGAMGNEFNVSATPTTQAANMKAAINASADVNTIFSADNVAGVLTITVINPGAAGNQYVISENLGNVSLATFASLATGSNGTSITVDCT